MCRDYKFWADVQRELSLLKRTHPLPKPLTTGQSRFAETLR
jgi:hypothetical protein